MTNHDSLEPTILRDLICDWSSSDNGNVFETDERITAIFEVYQRAAEIYRRTQVALGRAPRYEVTMSNTTDTGLRYGLHKTPKIQ